MYLDKFEVDVYVLRDVKTDEYLTDGGYTDILQFAGYQYSLEKAQQWLDILDFPEEFEIKKMRITREII